MLQSTTLADFVIENTNPVLHERLNRIIYKHSKCMKKKNRLYGLYHEVHKSKISKSCSFENIKSRPA